MARPQGGIKLKLRKARRGKDGSVTHRATWVIYDPDVANTVSTGCGEDDRAGAEEALERYLIEKRAGQPLDDGGDAHSVIIGDLIKFYLMSKWQVARFDRMKDERRREFVNQIDRLNEFWGDRTVSEINEMTALEYQEGRNPNTVRLELGILKAIINFGEFKGKLDKGNRRLDYAMPTKAKSRIHYYSRSEVAKLLWTAWRRKHSAPGFGEYYSTRHVVRFILTAVYTGTRADRIEQASYYEEDGRPWLDLDHGIFYRSAKGERVPSNKRADPVRIPKPLLEHMRRWKLRGDRYLIEYQGRPASVSGAFSTVKELALGEQRAAQVNRHTFRHTCATWLMQAGVSISLVAKYLSATEKVIEEVYGHHHPDFHAEADHAFSRGKAGRKAA